jgi:hypothetical protein
MAGFPVKAASAAHPSDCVGGGFHHHHHHIFPAKAVSGAQFISGVDGRFPSKSGVDGGFPKKVTNETCDQLFCGNKHWKIQVGVYLSFKGGGVLSPTKMNMVMLEGPAEPILQEEIDEELEDAFNDPADAISLFMDLLPQMPHIRGGITLVEPEHVQGCNASPERLIQRALYLSGHHNIFVFVTHGTPWGGIAYYYSGAEDTHMGFGPILVFPVSTPVSNSVRSMIRLNHHC